MTNNPSSETDFKQNPVSTHDTEQPMAHIASGQKCGSRKVKKSASPFNRPEYVLAAYLKNGKMPHALLFTGADDSRKALAATQLAKACNCNSPAIPGALPADIRLSAIPCGTCRPCKKIESGNHPDMIVVEPTGAFIRVDQVRSLQALLTLKPYEAKTRFILIQQAGALNPEAGNALLKVLEEPPKHTIVILTTPQPADLLPTVVSRCQQVRFTPLSQEQITASLEKKYRIPPETAGVIAQVARGNLARAASLAGSRTPDRWVNRRDWIIYAAHLEGSRPASPTAMVHLLAMAEQLSKNKDTLFDMLELLKSWIRDIIVYSYNPGRIVNKDLTQRIQYVSQHMARTSLMAQFAAVLKAQKDIAANANARIALDVMATTMAKIQNEKSSWHSI